MRTWEEKTDNTAPAPSGELTAAEDNSRGFELNNLVISAGVSLDPRVGPDTDNNMAAQAVTRIVSGALLGVDTGAVNAYVINLTGAFKPPKALFKGLRIKFYPGATNTGVSTINAFGLGVKKFFTHSGTAMAGGEVVLNRQVEADYDPALDGGSGAWRITPWSNALNFPVGTPTATQVTSGEGISVNTASPYNVDLNFPGLDAGVLSDPDLFAFYDMATSEHKTITAADLKDWLEDFIESTIINNTVITGSDVIKDEWNAATDGFATLGASTPTYDFPDVDLKYVAGLLTLVVNTRAVSTPSGNMIIEVSTDAGATWVTLNTQAVFEPGGFDPYVGSAPFFANYSGMLTFEWRANPSTGARQLAFQTRYGPNPPNVTLVTPAGTTIKARARYTGTGSPFRVHGYRVISDLGKPVTVTAPPREYDYAGA